MTEPLLIAALTPLVGLLVWQSRIARLDRVRADGERAAAEAARANLLQQQLDLAAKQHGDHTRISESFVQTLREMRESFDSQASMAASMARDVAALSAEVTQIAKYQRLNHEAQMKSCRATAGLIPSGIKRSKENT